MGTQEAELDTNSDEYGDVLAMLTRTEYKYRSSRTLEIKKRNKAKPPLPNLAVNVGHVQWCFAGAWALAISGLKPGKHMQQSPSKRTKLGTVSSSAHMKRQQQSVTVTYQGPISAEAPANVYNSSR